MKCFVKWINDVQARHVSPNFAWKKILKLKKFKSKVSFEITKKNIQIFVQQFLGEIFETPKKVQLDPFHALVSIENCSFHPFKMYLEADKMRCNS